jgi:Cu-processing system permease protein
MKVARKGKPGKLGFELKGTLLIARFEIIRTFVSVKSVIFLVLFFLLVGGGAYGVAELYNNDELGTLDPFLNKTVDSLVYLLSGFMAVLVPIAAVVLSFNSIVKERNKGTMPLLLVKPISKEALVLGKFLGVFGALSAQVLIISLVSLALIYHFTGDAPWLWNSVAFIVTSILLGGTYIGITQAASMWTKSNGTAVMAGLTVYLLFTMFWLLLPLGLALILGLPFDQSDPNYSEFLIFNNRIDLFNPNGAYNLCLAYQSGNIDMTEGVYPALSILSLLLWFFVPLTVLVLGFGRKEV